MEQNRATLAFATLGHPGRLAVFRLLMRFAPQGVRPTEIAEALGMKQNTLSHHLAELTASGLVRVNGGVKTNQGAAQKQTTGWRSGRGWRCASRPGSRAFQGAGGCWGALARQGQS